MQRRTFLQSGTAAMMTGLLGGAGSNLPILAASSPDTLLERRPPAGRIRNCILLLLHGGPSQLETFDPKPQAPAEVRGPFGAIDTTVPGMQISETLPRLAMLADRFALVRSLTWDGPAIHESGVELMLTGATGTFPPYPSLGSRLNRQCERNQSITPAVIVGAPSPQSPIAPWVTGQPLPTQRQTRRTVGSDSKLEFIELPQVSTAPGIRDSDRFGNGEFGRRCRLACALIDAGVRFVTVVSHTTLQGELSWDCHADGGDLRTTLQDYGSVICPEFDLGCAGLLERLHSDGLLAETLVIAVGEFGRTPRINARGGRDHSTSVCSALLAGGGIQGGAILGTSNHHGSDPATDPVSPTALFAMMESRLGLSPVTIPESSRNAQPETLISSPLQTLFA